MPTRDVADLARLLAGTGFSFVRFAIVLPQPLGGTIEAAGIIKHERLRWLRRASVIWPAAPI